MRYKNIDLKRIGLHVIFWLCIIGNTAYYYGFPYRISEWFFMSAVMIPVDIVHVYITLYFLIPKFLLKKSYYSFALLFISFGLINTVVCNIIAKYILKAPEFNTEGIFSFMKSGGWDIISTYSAVLLALTIKLARVWYKKNNETKKILEEKYKAEIKLKDAELKLLKAQVHPHFLFNTLNNLYGLTLENSKKAPEVVIKLSALLDYVLYRCNTQTVPLTNELAQIINYIDLEKLRYDESLKIDIKVSGNSESKEIAPLLILPFVENCFKHGVSKSSGNSWIKIDIKITDVDLTFIAENNKSNNQEGSGYKYTEGIGLKNVKQRLMLAYKENYKLNIEDIEDKFCVNLNIKLS